jgi:hypothetical protein
MNIHFFNNKVVLIILGLFAGVGGVMMFRSFEASSDPADIAAQSFELSRPEYDRSTNLVDSLRKNGGTIRNEEWLALKQQATTGTPDARAIALTAIAQISPKSQYRAESIDLANRFLAENHEQGNVPAILVLKKLGDSRWEQFAEKLTKSPNKLNVELGNQLLSRRKP